MTPSRKKPAMLHQLRTRAGAVRDRGSAMLMTLSVMLLLTTLAGVGTTMAVRDMRGAGEAQQAGGALDAAEAGLAQAVAYIRSNGTRKIACNLTTCPANSWSQGNPVAANVKGGGRWSAWIKPVSVGNPADGDSDTYLVHSTGTAGGPAERVIEVGVTVTPIGLPNAIFGRTINLGGTVDMAQISMFSTGCVYNRSHVATHAAVDAAYNVPTAVHSSQIITESQGSGQYCPNTNKPIHGGLSLLGVSLTPCSSKYPADQDRFGGSLLGGLLSLVPCAGVASQPAYQLHDFDLDGVVDVNGSFVKDDRALFRSFGIKRPALTEAEIEQLRTTAQAQGNYYTSAKSSDWTVPTGPHAVLFFDIGANDTVDLGPLGDPSKSIWARTALDISSPLCLDASLLVVITGGNAKMDSNMNLAAAIYMASGSPGGKLTKGNGTVNTIGMIYADTLDFAGNLNASLDTCYMGNPPPALFDVNPGTYRELDR